VGVELAYPKMRRELMIAAVRELGDVRGLGSSDRGGGGHQGQGFYSTDALTRRHPRARQLGLLRLGQGRVVGKNG